MAQGKALHRRTHHRFTRSLLAVALGHMGTGALVAIPLLAVPHAALAQAARSYNIPAGTLEDTLNRFGRESGILLSFSTDTTAGLKSPGLQGSHTLRSGLDALLAGSGLQAAAQPNGSYVLVKSVAATDNRSVDPTADTEATLGTITVVGKGNSLTEGTGSYTTGAMSTATKLPMTIRDTPQSLSVVTRQKIDDFAMQTIDDVAHSTTGVTVNRWSDDRSRYFARGFVISNFLLDGVPVSYETDTSTYSTMAMYDHVEVVRGPTGLMTGMGDPSGTINFVRKRPTRTPQYSLTARAGSWDNAGLELDASGPLNAAGSLRGRFVTALQDKGNFLDNYKNRKELVYGTLELDVTRDTRLSVGASYNNEDNSGSQWFGVPTDPDGRFLNILRSKRFSPSWSLWDKKEVSAFAELEHRFDNGWTGKLTSRVVHANSALAGAYFVGGMYDSAGRINYDVMGGEYTYDKDQVSVDASAQGPVTLFGRRHDIAVGLSRRNIEWNDAGNSYLDAEGNYSVISNVDPYTFNWDSLTRQGMVLDTLWTRHQKTTLTSAYATGRINLADPLNLIVGARLDWFDFENSQKQGAWSKYRTYGEDAHFTPYAALIHDLDDNHSVYASYSSIFKPQDYLDTSGQMLNPVEGRNYEVGFKASYLDERVNAAIAFFSTTQSNLPQAMGNIASCAVATNCYRSVGEVKSRGIDMDVSGELLPRLNVGVGYTYTQAKIAGDSLDGAKGQPYASYIPQHQLKFSTMYHLAGEYERWRVGGAVRAQSKTTSASYTREDGYVITQSPLAVVDFSVGYRLSQNLDVQLNIHNLFDKVYYETLQARNGANYFGPPRNFTLTLRAQF